VHALQAEGRTALAVRVWRTLLGVAWLIWLADLATKIWAVEYLANRGPVKVIGSLFQLNFIRNSGAAFSFAPGATLFLSFFGIAVLIAITYYAPSLTSKGWALVLGLVIAAGQCYRLDATASLAYIQYCRYCNRGRSLYFGSFNRAQHPAY
jgi:lipoprotein signal peptidase